MVRTQVELTEEQAAELRKQAEAHGMSLPELIRRGIEAYLGSEQPGAPTQECRLRAIAAAGRFGTGQADLSAHHDRYLAEQYGQ